MVVALLLLFVVMPLVELVVAVQVAHWLGFLPTLLLLVGLSLVGMWQVKRAGLGLWRQTRRQLRDGEVPGATVVDGLVRLVGALLLTVPGFVTAVAGLILFLPPVQVAVRGVFVHGLVRRVKATPYGYAAARGGSFAYARYRDARGQEREVRYVGDVTPPAWRSDDDGREPPALER